MWLQNLDKDFSASENKTPPPAIITGVEDFLIIFAAAIIVFSEGTLLGISQTRFLKKFSG